MKQNYRITGLPSKQLAPIALSHGWINLAPAQRLDAGIRYGLAMRGLAPLAIEILQAKRGVYVNADRMVGNNESLILKGAVRRMLSLGFPMRRFRALCRKRKESDLLDLASQGWGRMFRSPTAWEDAVKTLFTTNASWAYTQKMCSRLCELLGTRTLSGHCTFPSPEQVLAVGSGYLRKEVGVGYRSEFLLLLAETAAGTKCSWLLDPTNTIDKESAFQEISSWKGFGSYASSHLMVLLGFHDYLPVDREVANHLKLRSKGDRKRIHNVDHFQDWGEFRFTAYKLKRVAAKLNWIGD